MDDLRIKIECPKCQHPVEATLKKVFKLIMYTCPKCQSNVVFYDNKVDIISDAMVSKLRNNKKLQFFAMTNKKTSPKPSPRPLKGSPPVKKFRRSLSQEDIMDLKILLETEKDSGSFLSKI